jgi:uncharacterized protein (TIGR02145 family)
MIWEYKLYRLMILAIWIGAVFCFSVGCKNNLPDTVTDIEGNVYNTVKIGKQVWMSENLRTTKYRNGDPIPNVARRAQWIMLREGAYCNYNNNDSNGLIYGRLYNWYAVNDSRSIAPEGWRVAKDADFNTLVKFLGGDSLAGGKMKEAGMAHWQIPNFGANNSCGFKTLPAGYRNDYTGNYYLLRNNSMFWTTTENDTTAWVRLLNSADAGAYRNYAEKRSGLSVRCLKD